MAQHSSIEKSVTPSQLAAEVRLEEERMQEVILLLQTLFEREEITAKLIIGCMYDIGTVKLINRKFRCRPVNRFMQWTARFSKPVVRTLAFRRLKKNGPYLIANWLRGKVRFEEERQTHDVAIAETAIAETAIATTSMPTALEAVNQAALEASKLEVLRLRSQVKTLTTLLVTVTFTLGGTALWSLWQAQKEATQIQQVEAVYGDRALKSLPGQR